MEVNEMQRKLLLLVSMVILLLASSSTLQAAPPYCDCVLCAKPANSGLTCRNALTGQFWSCGAFYGAYCTGPA
jgi:hypothetical protein